MKGHHETQSDGTDKFILTDMSGKLLEVRHFDKTGHGRKLIAHHKLDEESGEMRPVDIPVPVGRKKAIMTADRPVGVEVFKSPCLDFDDLPVEKKKLENEAPAVVAGTSRIELDDLDVCSFFPVDNSKQPTVSTLVEICDERKVKLLMKNKFIDSKLKRQLTTYWKQCHTGEKNLFRVEYTYSRFSVNESGRLFARYGTGLQWFPRDVRAFLSSDYYVDVDQVNSLPNILSQVLKQHDISCPELDQYVEKRAEILKQYGLSKQNVVAMLLKSTEPSHQFFKKIHQAIYRLLVPELKKGDTFWSTLWNHINKTRQKDIKQNSEGSFVSLVTHTCEKRMLQHMKEFFEQEGQSVDVLVFDGCQIRKDPLKVVDQELLDRCREHVRAKTGFDVPLAIKPMQVSQKFLKDLHLDKKPLAEHMEEASLEEDKDEEEESEEEAHVPVGEDESLSIQKARDLFAKPRRLLNYLNNYFAKVTDENTIWYCCRRRPCDPWIWRSKRSTLEALEHVGFVLNLGKGKKKKVTQIRLFDWWVRQFDITTFKRMVLDPSYVGDKPGEELNMFRGFQATKLDDYDEEKLQPVLYHIKEVLNSGVERDYDYTIRWMASIVQNPSQKNGTAIVNFSNEQGTGKNILWEWFGEKIIGKDHYLYVKSIDDITGQFTSLHACRIFVVCDEVIFAGAHKSNNQMKSMITQSWQKMEKKGHDPIMIDNYMNITFLSNNDVAVKVEDTDRRHFVKRVSLKHLGDTAYFKNLLSHLDDQETANHFYTYLMKLDLGDFNVRQVPHTAEKEEMRAYCMSPIEQFVHEMKSGCVPLEYEHSIEKGMQPKTYYEPGSEYETTMDELWSTFLRFCKDNNAGGRGDLMTKIAFSRKIRSMLDIVNRSKDRHNGTLITLELPSTTSKEAEEGESDGM